MHEIHERYSGAVIWRAGSSTDYLGNPISGLEPYRERVCILELFEHEYENFEKMANEELAKETRQVASQIRGIIGHECINFYLNVRRALLHPSTAEKRDTPFTMAEYATQPSAKLDAIVEIVKHHLEHDSASAIQPTRAKEYPPDLFDFDPHAVTSASDKPDKIIIFSYFPASFPIIQMLSLHPLLRFNTALQKFKNSDRDGPHVLLISNVGSVGLNISFASIMIITDVLWSMLSDQQLIGHIWRYPQPKPVSIYQLVGHRSPDVLLNNISFDKGFIQDAFVNIGDSMSASSSFYWIANT
ncbi:P-loop containing nucleoside triphosphate hydrolase protein [Gloeopeniophorella convolvens]|nr:P-loop containing nucleoside triphosphate hydrolase protein [Gloeopeniophorella convolvens]